MKSSIMVVCFLFCLTAYATRAEVGDRHSEVAGSFSLKAPKGWEFREFPGMKYQIAFGPPANSFSPNINVVDEAADVALKAYVDGNLNTLRTLFEEFTLIKRDTFVTTRGLIGERLVTTSLHQKNLLRQTFYFLPGVNGKYFVVTCSTSARGGEALDSVFEESIKTFEIVK